MIKKGTTAKVVLLAALFFFMVMVGGCNLVKMNPEAEKKQTVAKIGEKTITKQDFNYYLTLTKINAKVQGQEFPTDKEQLAQVNSQILDNLAEDQLMLQLAQKEEVKVDEKKAQEQIKEWRELLQGDLGGEEEYKKFLQENDITVEEFDDFLKNIDINNQYITGLYEKITKDAKVTDEDVVKYYQENTKQFDPSTVEAKHILAETEEKAKEIEKKAKEGKDFDALIKEYNGKEGIREAADLGEFQYTKMIPAFSEVVFKMEPGEISNPIQTDYGFHIVKVEKKNEKPVQKLDEVRETITEQLEQTVKYEKFTKYTTENREKIDIKKYPDKL